MEKKVFQNKVKGFFALKFFRDSKFLKQLPKKIRKVFNKSIKKIGRIFRKLKKPNLYHRFREKLISRYLGRIVSLQDKQLLATWQPFLWILVKISLVSYLSFRFYQLYPLVAGLLSDGLAFFRLDEIYNFQFPDKVFFLKVSRYLLGFIVGYYGLYFLYQQIRALFSSLIVHKGEQKIYYIDNTLFKKQVYIFSVPELELISLGQNLLFRPLGMGNIVLYKRNGEKIVIPALNHAARITRAVTEIKKATEPGLNDV